MLSENGLGNIIPCIYSKVVKIRKVFSKNWLNSFEGNIKKIINQPVITEDINYKKLLNSDLIKKNKIIIKVVVFI